EPDFSPDGKSLVYTTWNDTSSGAIYKVNLTGNAKPVKVTSLKGIYRQPAFSADGKLIVYRKEGGSNVLGPAYTSKPGIYYQSSQGGEEFFVADRGDMPRFNKEGTRIYYQVGGGLDRTYRSRKLSGDDERTHLKSHYGSQFTLSPDEKWIAFVDLHKVYVAAFPKTGKELDISSNTTDFPLKLVSLDAGFNLHWSADNKQLHYTLGDQYYSINLADRFSYIAGRPDSLFKLPEHGTPIGLTVKTDKPEGMIAFTNARIITMNGDKVIENGVILVEGNLIKEVGATGSVNIPSRAKVIDCNGSTIMPGFINAHAHGNHFRSGITPKKHPAYFANLAFGVTTMHDPSANSEMVFAQSELVKSGKMVGPRVFSTGTILYGAD